MVKFLGDFDMQKNRDAEPKPNGTGYLISFAHIIATLNFALTLAKGSFNFSINKGTIDKTRLTQSN